MSILGLEIKPLKTEKLKNNQIVKNGGPRPNSGRKPGKFSAEKIARIKVEQDLKDKIVKCAEKILNAQLSIAVGTQYLFKITENKKGVKLKPQLVTDTREIEKYLDGEYGSGENINLKNKTEYFYLTTERPNQMAIANLWDRAFGKPKDSIKLEGNITLEQIITKMKDERGEISPL